MQGLSHRPALGYPFLLAGSTLFRSVSRHSFQPLFQTVPGYLEVVLALQPHPERGRVSEEAREQQSRLRRDGPFPVDDGVNPPRVHAYGLGQPVLGDLHRQQELFIENLSRVDGRHFLGYFIPIYHGNPLSVVVGYLHLVGFSFAPDKADPPLVVDADAVLPPSISRQGLQPVPWGRSQVVEATGVVQDHQLHLRPALNVGRKSADPATLGNGLGVPVPIASDHALIIVCYTIMVNRYERR